MLPFIESLIFLLFILFFLYLPSHCLFNLLSIHSFKSKLSEIGLKIGFGLVFFTLISFLIRYLGLSQLIYWLIPLLTIVSLIYQKKMHISQFNFPISSTYLFIGIVIAI